MSAFFQGAYKSWKVMKFKTQIFRAWKVMDLGQVPGKSKENHGKLTKWLPQHI